MPLYNINGKCVLFVHIPKCGGTTIESVLGEEFGDPAFFGRPKGLGEFNLQHADAGMLKSMLSEDLVDYSVVVTRNPFDKLISTYQWTYKNDLCRPNVIPPFPVWLDYVLYQAKRNPYHGNNFFRPQVDFIFPRSEVFKLEEGLHRVIDRVQDRLGISVSATLGHKYKTDCVPNIFIDEYSIQLIRNFYRADFNQLDYSDEVEDLLKKRSIKLVEGKCSRVGLWTKFFYRGGYQKAINFARVRLK